MPYGDPKYPVINPSPSVDNCLRSLRFSDLLLGSVLTGGSWSFGYIFGKPVRMPTASTAAALGLTAATFALLQNGRSRLMGYTENQREVGIYGAYPVQPELRGAPKQDWRYPTATGRASPSTRPPLDWNNYS